MGTTTSWVTGREHTSNFAVPTGLMGRLAGRVMFWTNRQRDLLPLLGIRPGEHVLEIGYGPGKLLRLLSRTEAARVAGVDPSPEMRALATRKAPGTPSRAGHRRTHRAAGRRVRLRGVGQQRGHLAGAGAGPARAAPRHQTGRPGRDRLARRLRPVTARPEPAPAGRRARHPGESPGRPVRRRDAARAGHADGVRRDAVMSACGAPPRGLRGRG